MDRNRYSKGIVQGNKDIYSMLRDSGTLVVSGSALEKGLNISASDICGSNERERDDDPGHHHPYKRIKSQENGGNTSNLCELDDNFAQQNTFPKKLMELLDNESASDALWWLPEGDAFAIDPKKFTLNVLKKSFQGTKFESFIRKLTRWGFKRLVGNRVPPNTITYFHHSFTAGKPELLNGMSVKKKKVKANTQRVTATNNLKIDIQPLIGTYSPLPYTERPDLVQAPLVTSDSTPVPRGREKIPKLLERGAGDKMDWNLILQSKLAQHNQVDFALHHPQALSAAGSHNLSQRSTAAVAKRATSRPSVSIDAAVAESKAGNLDRWANLRAAKLRAAGWRAADCNGAAELTAAELSGAVELWRAKLRTTEIRVAEQRDSLNLFSSMLQPTAPQLHLILPSHSRVHPQMAGTNIFGQLPLLQQHQKHQMQQNQQQFGNKGSN